ncbi:methylase [Ferrigenium kumadai]|uniref:Methylase n=1 Tax=Ferrigenium kumadai TaxID=1682490 RepID=A0AAN1T2G6_9PROT|nr:class I SAM-dependent methyltransferase [Ferrigenium kumadai]BBJ00645.1 methylase [Ferrigenium kumadai]
MPKNTTDFNAQKFTYKEVIEEKISFAGKGLDFYTKVKADFIKLVISKHLSDACRPKVLDIGCGHGFIHPMLHSFGYDVTGVEPAEEVLSLAQMSNPENRYCAYDGQVLPFAEASFDVALAICVMHHVAPSQWAQFLAEARRVLRPGGQIIIFEHNPLNPLTSYVVAHNDIDVGAVLLPHRKLADMLRQAGFENVYARSILFTPFAHHAFRRLDERLGWLPFGAQYYATGTVV